MKQNTLIQIFPNVKTLKGNIRISQSTQKGFGVTTLYSTSAKVVEHT